MEHPFLPSEMAPNDFWHFEEDKVYLKGTNISGY
jgi:hypothetical protein